MEYFAARRGLQSPGVVRGFSVPLLLGRLVGTGEINDNVQIVRQKIRTLETVSEGKIPLESVRGPVGLARRYGGFRFASPVEIRLNIVEGADPDVRSRDRRLAPSEPQLFIK